MKRIDIAVEITIKKYCPRDFGTTGLTVDDLTHIEDSKGLTIGCRGIECKECWNKEAVE